MADEKVQSNGNVTVWWVPAAGIADYRSPTAAEINDNGIDLTDAIAWENFDLGATESNDIDDRSLRDLGNAVTRGFAQFGATLSFFRSLNPDDPTSDYTIAFETFRNPRVHGYLITRVLQVAPNTHVDAAPGEWISVYKVVGDYLANDTEGEDSYKFTVGFLPQGQIKVNTQVKNTTPVAVAPATLTVAVGEYVLATATLGGKSITQGARWVSASPNIATVTPNGVIQGIASGTAVITADHPAATGPGTATVTVS